MSDAPSRTFHFDKLLALKGLTFDNILEECFLGKFFGLQIATRVLSRKIITTCSRPNSGYRRQT